METTSADATPMRFDAFAASCPSRRLLDTIGNKWSSLAIVALGLDGRMRYSELSARIDGVSQKMLTQTLRNLERDGLLTRTVTPSVPVRVDYELTPLGLTLLEPMRHIKEWAEAHMPEVDIARAAYDHGHDG
jgi:DNA-binding HxlR family transcriptional regulator